MNSFSTKTARLEARIILMTLAEQDRFAQTLMSPPKAFPALERAFTRHRKLVTSK